MTLQQIASAHVRGPINTRIVAFAVDLARCGVNARTIKSQALEQFGETNTESVIMNSLADAARRLARQHQ